MEIYNEKKFKDIVIIMGVLIILLAFFIFYFILNSKHKLYSEQLAFLSEVSEKNALLIETKVNGFLNKLEAMSLSIGVDEKININESLDYLKNNIKNDEFKRMGIILLDGKAYTTDNYELELGDRAYFTESLKGKNMVSGRLIDKADGLPINVFSTPIYHSSKVVGVLFATKNTKTMSEFLEVKSFNGEGKSHIIKQDGTPIIYSLNTNEFKKYTNFFDELNKNKYNKKELLKTINDIKKGNNGSNIFINEGVKNQISYAKINFQDWYIVTTVPYSAIARESIALIYNLSISSVVIYLIIIILSIININSYRKNNEKLSKIAFYDNITDHYNWNKFRLECDKKFSEITEEKYALIYLDINKFKMINDIFGYDKGNDVLNHIAKVIKDKINSSDLFARVHVDSYCILSKYHKVDDIIDIIKDINVEVKNYINGYHIQLSYGICMIDGEYNNISHFFDRANIAKQKAKNRVDIDYVFYDEEIRKNILKELEIENCMEESLEKKEFKVHLQPKYDIKTESIIGAEALVRWIHAEKGMIFPNEFIPIFEKNGFIKKLDFYMFEEVCILLKEWKDIGRKIVPISVNISRVNLSTHNLANILLDIANKYNIEPKYLEIELTESAVFEDTSKLISIMKDFKNIGFSVSVDDFGSGYSSLNSLKDLSVDIIKLDGGFLKQASDNERGKIIIKSLIDMSKKLSMIVVAEGVETKEQLEFLRNSECDIAQGYYYSRPVPVSDFEKL